MPRRLTNDLLLALLLAQVLGGVLGWALPVATAAPLYDLHRALGVGIILLLGWKQAIAFNSLRAVGCAGGGGTARLCGAGGRRGLLGDLAPGWPGR